MIIEVADPSQVAAVRRTAVDMARSWGADDGTAGRVAIVASELVSNLLKHATRGDIALDFYDDGSGAGLELLAFDRGQGIGDISRAMADGYSTAGTTGSGLGSIQRQSDHFEVYSRPQGTVMMARIALRPAEKIKPGNTTTLGIVHSPYPGEILSGDAWAYGASALGPTLMVVDGSGHGPLAASAAMVAVNVFRDSLNESCVDIMDRIHRAMAPTRGGAVAIACVDGDVVRYVGVGNIAGAVHSSAVHSGTVMKRMVSHNGTAGLTAPRIREFTYPCARPATIMLHSDGLSAKWDLAAYPGLATHHPSVIGGVLFRDCWRRRDDGLVAVMRVE